VNGYWNYKLRDVERDALYDYDYDNETSEEVYDDQLGNSTISPEEEAADWVSGAFSELQLAWYANLVSLYLIDYRGKIPGKSILLIITAKLGSFIGKVYTMYA
jgi:hypothetical protein